MKMLCLFMLAITTVFAEEMYGKYSKVINLDDVTFKARVLDSDEIWIVEFYAPWCGHCKQFKPEYEKAAKALNGVVRVGAVNMDEHKQTGQKYGVTGFPTVKFFGLNKKGDPTTYSGQRTGDDLVKYALGQVKSQVNDRLGGKKDSSSSKKESGSSSGGSNRDEVVVLTESNFNELVLKSKDIWIVEFYAPWCGHCKALEPEYKEAAGKLKGQVKLGKVDATEHSNLANRFGVKGYPTIKVFDYGDGKKDSKAYDYQGARTAQGIVDYASDLAERADIEPEVHELVSQSVYDKTCQGAVICVVNFLPNIYDSNAKERNSYLKTIMGAVKTNRKQPFVWFWLSAGDQLELERSLNLGFGFPAVVAISPGKKMVGTMRSSFATNNLNSFLSDLLIGKGGLENLSSAVVVKKADKWDGKDAAPLEDDSSMYDDL